MPLPILLSGSDSQLKTEVFNKFRNGDRASFKTIFEFYYSFVYRFVAKIINHDEDAADITSDTFFTLWEKKEELKEPRALKTYLFTIASNAAKNYLKKNKVELRYVREMSHTMEVSEFERESFYHAEVFFNLEQLMTTLPNGCRTVFEMIYFENLKTEEIASRLRITTQTVLNQKRNAIIFLRKAIHLQNNVVLLELYELLIRHH